MSEVLMQAHNQWARRPDDERYVSLEDMLKHFIKVRQESRALVSTTRRIEAAPLGSFKENGIQLSINNESTHYEPTNYGFGQLAYLAQAPAGYLRKLPSAMAADCLNYGLRFQRNVDEVGLLLQSNGQDTLRAATGPNYGRIWNEEILRSMVERFGDGVTGQWKVPGEFGKPVPITKANTTLYASDRDMFTFLCDEENRIVIPNRRAGASGSLARGFFVWNSEVGASTFGVGTFLFDYACQNRMIWGAEGYNEIRIRHTAGAPDRFLEEITPALQRYSESSSDTITNAIEDARKDKLEDKVQEFLSKRFGSGLVQKLSTIHELEELRPIETRWDAVVAATAYARNLPHQDTRVGIERIAGKLLHGNN